MVSSNIISKGFDSWIVFHAEFFKILSHVNITVTFETEIVSAEHYHTPYPLGKTRRIHVVTAKSPRVLNRVLRVMHGGSLKSVCAIIRISRLIIGTWTNSEEP